MTDVKFSDQNEAFDHIVEVLASDVPAEIARGIAEQYLVRCEIEYEFDDWPPQVLPSGEITIGAPFGRDWTVRERELKNLKELAVAIVGAYGAPERLSPIVTLAIGAFCMLQRLHRHGVNVNPLQRSVLIALRKSGPSTEEQLVPHVGAIGSHWHLADVSCALAELAAARLNDGSVEPLVHRSADGLWSTDARGLWELPFGSIG